MEKTGWLANKIGFDKVKILEESERHRKVQFAEGEKAGMLVISELGAVEGEVRAAHLVVAGRINGPVRASELVELQPKARISGDVHYRALEMHNGAIVDGTLVYAAGESTAKAGLKLAPSGPRPEVAKTEAQAG